MRSITPPKINIKAIERAILLEKRKKGEWIIKYLNKTVKSWESKPGFKADLKVRGDDIVITITITGSHFDVMLWTWLDEGVPPSLISGNLAFPNRDPNVGGRMYVQETKPGELVSRQQGGDRTQDGPFHRPGEVLWPGIEARKWTLLLRDMMQQEFGTRTLIELKRIINEEMW